MLHSHVKFLKHACFIPSLLGSILVCWNTKTKSLNLVKDFQTKRKFSKGKLYLFMATSIIFFLSGMYKVVTQTKTENSWIEAFVHGFDSIAMIWGISNVSVNLNKAEIICQYVSGLLRYQKQFGQETVQRTLKERTSLELLNLSFAYGATYLATFWMPLGITFGLHWSDPCKASITFHRLLPECRNKTTDTNAGGLISKTLVLMVDLWRWMFTEGNAGFSVSVLLILCTWTLKENLEM